MDALAQEAVIVIQNAAQHQRLQLMHKRLKDEQEKRLAAEKWSVMGQAATSLAHRINNIIGTLPASANELQRTLKEVALPEADRKWVDANIDRIRRNAGFFLKLSDALFRPFKESGPPHRFDINRVLNEALESAELSDRVQLACDFEKDLPEVESSPLLVDIFLELITNARKAMADRPLQRLRLSTRSEVQDWAAGWWLKSATAAVEFQRSGCRISGTCSSRAPMDWGSVCGGSAPLSCGRGEPSSAPAGRGQAPHSSCACPPSTVDADGG